MVLLRNSTHIYILSSLFDQNPNSTTNSKEVFGESKSVLSAEQQEGVS